MARPEALATRIFLDGSDTGETQKMIDTIGFVDGQTTNPSNFIKALRQERGDESLVLPKDELYALYKARVQEIAVLIPAGSVSIEVYADEKTTAQQMIDQGREMFAWIPNAHIKLPIIPAGLEAAEVLIAAGMRVNMTLCFAQEQAAAVYAATRGAKKGDVFISPFIGRVNDKGRNGIDIVKNILRMYEQGDGHVEVLAASIRNGAQLTEAIVAGTDITTSYFAAIEEWGSMDMPIATVASRDDLVPIPYEEIALDQDWHSYNISHPMTDDGLARFAKDWKGVCQDC